MATSINIYGTDENDTRTGTAPNGKTQVHVSAKAGNDTINLDFANIDKFSHGHHARGDGGSQLYEDSSTNRGNDTFNFQNVVNVEDIVVGRIEDFDSSRDNLEINGNKINISQLQSGSGITGGFSWRIVEYDADTRDNASDKQQWILIDTGQGYIFYALEGARVTNNKSGASNGGNQEAHFIGAKEGDIVTASELAALNTVGYEDPINYVPAGYTADGGEIINDDDENWQDQGTDQIDGSANGDLIAAGLNDDTVRAGAGNDVVWGGSGNDILHGDNGNDTLHGGTGNDRLHGNKGNDTLNGAGGNDSLYGGNGEDTILGGDGNDLINGGAMSDVLYGGNNSDVLYGENGDDFIDGQTGADELYGGNGNDDLFGGSGNDEIYGGDGNDLLSGGTNDDLLYAGSGNDRVWGGNGRDTVHLGDDDDTFYDNAQNSANGGDIVYGGAGNDIIYIGGGNDRLTGGSGEDRFVFTSSADGRNVITDFELGIDTLEFTGVTSEELSYLATGSGVRVEWGDNFVKLDGVNINEVDSIDFVFS